MMQNSRNFFVDLFMHMSLPLSFAITMISLQVVVYQRDTLRASVNASDLVEYDSVTGGVKPRIFKAEAD